MNCTPKGTEPVIGVTENLASGAGVLLLVVGVGEDPASGAVLLLQATRPANTSTVKARIVRICLAFSQLKDLDFLSNP